MTWPEIRDYVRQALSWVVRFSTVSATGSDGYKDAVDGRAGADETSYQYPVRRLWPFGIRSRPPVGVDAVVIHVNGGSGSGVMVGAESNAYGPDDLAEGEVAIYCRASGAVIKLDADGKITIDAASGQDVVVNGGTLKVARETDPCRLTAAPGGALAVWMGQVESAISGLAGVVPTPLAATFVATPGITVKTGADHLKG